VIPFGRTLFMLLAAAGFAAAQGQSPGDRDEGFLENSVRPILIRRCFGCHGPDSPAKGGLRMDSREALLRGGETGPTLAPGDPDRSLLVRAIRYGDSLKMPPKGKLPEEEIAALTRWVRAGAPWPAEAHWAFRPPIDPTLPRVRNPSWPKSPIDHFVLARLEAAGLAPAPEADRRTLLRRATFDLHGLPPTPEEIDAFVADESPGAFERVVDRLLASPRYGERWGRRWLDVARYADSNGSDRNLIVAHAWRFRDYVIRSFNEDKPYDRFVVEQLAGDLVPAADRGARQEGWVATGFLALGPKPLLKNDNELAEMDVVDEQIEAVGRAFLALTLGCSRCHDHKFDPLPTTDYYALAGIFKSTRSIDRYDLKVERAWTERALGSDEQEADLQRLKQAVERADDLRRLTDDPEKAREFARERDRLRKEAASIPAAVAVKEGEAADCAVHVRGEPQNLGERVPRGFPRILGGHGPPIGPDRSGRLELARWITAPGHPLTARVLVNRLWKGHFGEGLVRSTDNFGRLGQRPDHPELLDWLARRFVEDGGSIKRMHRRMMLSATYAMGARRDERAARVDPENRLRWEFPRRRLEAEEIRDGILAVAGLLDLTAGGPALPAAANFEAAGEKAHVRRMLEEAYARNRRSVYLPVIRSGLYELFRVFDFADPSVPTGRREASTVASQALFMMNSDLVRRAAGALGARARREGGPDAAEGVRRAYRLAYGRLPSADELRAALEFLDRYAARAGREAAWVGFCRSLLSSNEFLFID
jgi:mono/diheme cytochrome c family protein